MPRRKRDKIESRLRELAALRGRPLVGNRLKMVEEALESPSNLVTAAAIKLLRNSSEIRLIPVLRDVFERYLQNPVKSDPGCLAKLAVVDTLNYWETEDVAVYLQGISHVQQEPVIGGTSDTAAELRGQCLAGLVSVGYREALFHAVPLLVDPEPETRYLAVRALGRTGAEGAELLLRMKALAGDEDSRITGECLAMLLSLHPERSLAFVAEFMDHEHPEIQESAALALGESRLPDAFAVLKRYWDQNPDSRFRETLILPIALLRMELAAEFLIGLLGGGNRENALSAMRALAIYRADQGLVDRIEAAVDRQNQELRSAFAKHFHS